jgi:hypothetical protein
MHWRRFLFLALAGSVAAIGLACGSSKKISTDPSKARLVGKITYQGKPFPGIILVQSEDNSRTAQAAFAPDGSYVVTDVPIGKVKLGLLPPPRPRRRPVPEGQDSEIKQPNMIPPQYNDPSKSGLTVEIHGGRTEYSVDLP